MKKIRLNKIWRRFFRTLGTLFTIWFVWSIFYILSWERFPERKNEPLTIGVNDHKYNSVIEKVIPNLKKITKQLDVPSFSIAVGHKGKIILSAAVGYQNIHLLKPATPKTQYRIGSTSKSITATGVAKLVNTNNINLDAIIGDTIKNWTKKRWSFTMRQLLSHTAGVGNYTDFGIASGKYTICNCYQFNSASEGLKVFDQYKLLYEPGTAFQYSTFDINLASVVLEQAANQPFLEYMHDTIFNPLNMQDTYADHTLPKTKHFATFYETKDGYYREYRTLGIKHDVNLSYKWAGGGFISTPTDLVKMGNAYLNDSTFLSYKTKKEFWSPVKLKNGKVNEQLYALGWRSYLQYESESLLKKEPVWMVHHGGVSKGSMNFLILFPNYNLVIDASINARANSFQDFSLEVRKIANYFLEVIEKNETQLYRDLI